MAETRDRASTAADEVPSQGRSYGRTGRRECFARVRVARAAGRGYIAPGMAYGWIGRAAVVESGRLASEECFSEAGLRLTRPAGSRFRSRFTGAAPWAGVLLSALWLACGGDSEARGPEGERPPVAVQVTEVRSAPLPRTVETVGTLLAPGRTTIAAELEEQVVRLEIPEGELVEAGQLLAALDPEATRAEVERARARLDNVRQRKERLESLRASSVTSQQAYDDAAAELDMAQAEFAEARTRLAKTEIRAPFAGVLGLSLVTPGQYVKPGDPIVRITRTHPLDLVFSIPQERARELALEQSVLGDTGTCDNRFEGRIYAIEPRVDPATRSVLVKARVPNEAGSLWSGMATRVRVVVETVPEAIRIPQEALVREGGRHVVYVLDANGQAQQRVVDLGAFFVDGVHIRNGLEPGERLVVNGHQRLRPGTPTRAEPYRPVDNPTLDLGWAGPADGCEG